MGFVTITCGSCFHSNDLVYTFNARQMCDLTLIFVISYMCMCINFTSFLHCNLLLTMFDLGFNYLDCATVG
jgi:hypothetical protein